jgi:hypothetical protein
LVAAVRVVNPSVVCIESRTPASLIVFIFRKAVIGRVTPLDPFAVKIYRVACAAVLGFLPGSWLRTLALLPVRYAIEEAPVAPMFWLDNRSNVVVPSYEELMMPTLDGSVLL